MLEARLRALRPDLNVEVINSGVAGWGTGIEWLYLDQDGYKFQPDLVLVSFFIGNDLYEHLKRIDGFNRRAERPTTWDTELHASPDCFERMLRERPGNVVVLSGRNRGKIDRVLASVKAGLHVLADKPWILRSGGLPMIEEALAEADKRAVVAYDIMTERFEITSVLQRALVNDAATFGEAGGNYPYWVAIRGNDTAYVSSVRDREIVVVDLPSRRIATRVKLTGNPSKMIYRLY